MGLYDRDFHAWAHEQAALARSRSGNALDWDNVAQELEGLGKHQQSELASRYRVLVMQLLKWLFQPQGRGASWEATIKVQRKSIARHLRKNLSLKATDEEAFRDCYDDARLGASQETGIAFDLFPENPPFTPEQARDPEFWPDRAEAG
jgi:hypothetical protein